MLDLEQRDPIFVFGNCSVHLLDIGSGPNTLITFHKIDDEADVQNNPTPNSIFGIFRKRWYNIIYYCLNFFSSIFLYLLFKPRISEIFYPAVRCLDPRTTSQSRNGRENITRRFTENLSEYKAARCGVESRRYCRLEVVCNIE